MRASRILPARERTSSGVSPLPIPSRTTRPGPISPVTRSPTRTRAPVTRWTTARTLMLNLDQTADAAFVLETKGDGVAQFAARIQAQIEQVARHHVAERLEHRLLGARVLAFE